MEVAGIEPAQPPVFTGLCRNSPAFSGHAWPRLAIAHHRVPRIWPRVPAASGSEPDVVRGRPLQALLPVMAVEALREDAHDAGYAELANRVRRDVERIKLEGIVLVAAVVGTVALTETLLASSAVSDATYVRSGHAVQPTFLGVPLVSWGARAVEVAWDGQPPAGFGTLVDHCFLYLGQGAGVVLLYDHDTGRTVRVSSSAVVLSIQPQADYERVCPR